MLSLENTEKVPPKAPAHEATVGQSFASVTHDLWSRK